jgi:RNA-binding protein MEX3
MGCIRVKICDVQSGLQLREKETDRSGVFFDPNTPAEYRTEEQLDAHKKKISHMPSSLIHDMERSSTGQLEADQRALQIALELSMLGLTNDDDSTPISFDDIRSSKKSMNTTECVPVPSSEHVAEIVGRQGMYF